MAMSAKLDLRQSQTLVMTPQLQQAIKLLQMSSIELAAFVEEELEQNPLLEQGQADSEAPDDTPEETAEPNRTDIAEDAYDPPGKLDGKGDYHADDEAAPAFDTGTTRQGSSSGGSFNGDNLFGVEQTVASTVSLYDHLAQPDLSRH